MGGEIAGLYKKDYACKTMQGMRAEIWIILNNTNFVQNSKNAGTISKQADLHGDGKNAKYCY